MIKLTQLCLLLVIFFLATPVKASLLVEPVVGLNLNSKLDMDGTKYSGGGGLGYGGRLGWQRFGLQLGADFFHSSIDMSDNTFKKNLKMDEWAGFVGYEFPVLLRVYAGYIFSANGTTRANINNVTGNLKLDSGSGYKLGVGFTGLPFLDINLEYRSIDMDGKFNGTAANNNKFNTLMLGLSLPLNL